IANEKDWMAGPPSFTSEEQSNNTLASIILICIMLRIIKKYFKFSDFSIDDSNKYMRYLNDCIDIIIKTPETNTRQFCTIPQIAYYIVEALTQDIS
ncbi:MAG: hypothetical protein V1709_10850, partial [Planctomycetota bacterium]